MRTLCGRSADAVRTRQAAQGAQGAQAAQAAQAATRKSPTGAAAAAAVTVTAHSAALTVAAESPRPIPGAALGTEDDVKIQNGRRPGAHGDDVCCSKLKD